MSLTHNVVYNILINVLNVAIPIITVPYVSRVFGVENVGVVNFALTYAAYFSLFVCLGIPVYGVREIGKCKDDPVQRNYIVSELFRIMLISTLFFTSLYVISIFVIPTLYAERVFLLAAGAGLIFSPFNVDWYYTGRENLKIVALRNMAVKILGVAILFIFVRSSRDIILYLILNTIANVGAQVWTFVYMLRHEIVLQYRKLNLKRHIKPVLILFLSSLAISIYTMLDTLMLGFLSDYTQVGYYSSAIKISRLLLPLVTAAAAASIPRIAYLYKENNRSELNRVTNKAFSFMALLAPPITIGLIAISKPFVPWFFGEAFMGAVPSMMVVSIIVLLIGVNNFYGPQVLLTTGNDKAFMGAVILGTISNFMLNLFFIPCWGALGASWASVVAESIVTATVIILASRLVPEIKPDYRPLIHSIAASLPMLLYGYVFSRYIDSLFWSVGCITIFSVLTFGILELFVFRDSTALDIRNRIFSKLRLQ
ncbi:flippase [Rikenella microfusus]|uniref:O-antigen transporter n=1 Tax=Rikenella microfusus TaxID=28139 RepID=A0A379MTK0_9BACT|nr:flippase [Rikenella microfusus]SUE34863.1 Putative O-antigen transporter [Rikenella microfusus]